MVRNLRLFYAFSLFMNTSFFIPISTLYFYSRGLAASEILFLESVFSATMLISAVPLGAIADRIGRKYVLFAGALGQGFSCFLLFFSDSMWLFLLSQILFGLFISMVDDADQALLYDLMKEVGQQEKYSYVIGNVQSYSLFSMALCFIVGGYIGKLDLGYPFLLSAVFFVLAAVVALIIKEPKLQVLGEQKGVRPGFTSQMRDMVSLFKNNRRFVWMMGMYAILITIMQLSIWLNQFYMLELGLPADWFGYLFATMTLLAAIVSRLTTKIEKFLGTRNTLFLIPLLLVLSLFLMGSVVTVWGLLFIAMQQISKGIYVPIFSNYSNLQIPSHLRATALSTKSFLGNLIFIVITPVIGLFIDHSFRYTMIGLSVVVLLITVFFATKWEPSMIEQDSGKEAAL